VGWPPTRSTATTRPSAPGCGPAGSVPWEFVAAEGEGDDDLEGWRAGHRSEWAAEGITVDDDTQVVCLRFVLV
jgi:uncharacterized protein YhfF